MATPVTMPQLGETVVEGTILRWLKQEGETVDRDEPLFEISTDKVDTEVPSPVAGTVVKILVPEGETVSVGTELVQIDEGGAGSGDGQAEAPAAAEPAEALEAPAEVSASEGEAAAVPAPETQEPAASGNGSGQAAPPPAQPPTAPPPPGQPEPSAAQAVSVESAPPVRTEEAPAPGADGEGVGERSHILSPLVRRLAEENGIDLSQVRGTGTGGRITKKDVLDFAASGAAAPAAAPAQAPAAPTPAAAPSAPAAVPAPAAAVGATGQREQSIPMSHIRKAIAKHMATSIQTTARAWNMIEVDMESIVRVREAAKDAFKAREGISLTYTPFVARAVCDALLAFPQVNSEIRGEEMILKQYVNLGIAVSYDEGLIVPVVKGADEMNIVGLARAINDLATRARSRKLKPDEVTGGSFTITNPGPFGSILSVPIISLPQTGILAFDAIEKRAVVVNDAIAIRHRVYLSMSWDHRAIDGADAAKFLARLKEDLETWDFGPELGLPPRQD